MKTVPSSVLSLLSCGALLCCASCEKADENPAGVSPITDKTVTLDCAKSDVTTSTTWADVAPGDAVDYVVTCPVTVKGSAVLTIAPGVIVQFEGTGTGLFTEDNAGLTAVGTAANPIKFVGKNPVKGAWKGVLFGSNNPANQLAYVTVLHAGSENSSWARQKAAVAITSLSPNGRASLTNCTISESDGCGLWVGISRNLSAFSNNTISHCTLAPLALSFDLLGKLDATSKYKDGNGQPYIDVYEGSVADGSGDLLTNVTVVPLEVPYRVATSIQTKAALTIQAGTVLEFVAGAGLSTFELGTGTINAVGTADKRITFRGVQAGKGSWVGIAVASSSSANEFVNCDISGGGSQAPYSGNTGKGNLVFGYFSNPVSARIQGSRITNSNGWGIWKTTNTQLVQSNNTFGVGTEANTTGDIGPK